jgi:hypothetical protein
MQNVPDLIYENSSWFIYYTNQLDLDRVKAANKQNVTANAPTNALRGPALMSKLNSMQKRKK